jgi:lipopolysaccharide assembly protein A
MAALIAGLVVVGLVALFSVQNASPVTISFLVWRFEASLAIVIFLSALAGALGAVIIYSSRSIKKSLSARKNRTQDPLKPASPASKEE